MVIANPIYDVVFKMLMQNKRIARFFIETILEEQVEDVEFEPQEVVYNKDNQDFKSIKVAMAIARFDFVATIKTETGQFKKILIEIQKARHPMDMGRFRNYLGINYQKEDVVYLVKGKKKIVLPIVSIYLLGFNLPEIQTPILKVARQYIDQISNTIINKKSDFIEKLTHDCHIVQILRIENKLQSKLEKLLSVFEQKGFIDETGTAKEFSYYIDDIDIKEMTDLLHYVILDPETKKEIDAEQEAYRVYTVANEELEETHEKLAEAEDKLVEKDKKLVEKDKKIEENEKLIDELKKELDAIKKANE